MRKINRRTFIRGAGVTVGASTVGIGSTRMENGPVGEAQAVIPLAVGAAIVGGAAIGYAVHEGVDMLTGDDFDEEAYQESQAAEVHTGMYESAAEMTYYDDSTLTNLENVLANSEQVAYSDARKVALEEMNLESSESDVIAAAEEEANSFFTVQLTNLFEHFHVQMEKFDRMWSTVNGTDSLDGQNVFEMENEAYGGGGNHQPNGFTQRTYTMPDGTDYTYQSYDYDNNWVDPVHTPKDELAVVTVTPVDGGSDQVLMDPVRFFEVRNQIETHHQNVVDDITSFVESIYPDYQAGDIDLADVVSGSDLASMASDDQENPLAGADLAAMGLSANTESQMTVELLEDEMTLDGSIYMMNAPDGGLTVGETYSPGDYSGPVYLAYAGYDGDETVTDDGGNEIEMAESDLIVVDQDFAILSAEDMDGNDLENVDYSDPSEQSTTTTDVDELNDELDRLAELQEELQTQQEEIAKDDESPGGGGGFDLSGLDAFGIPGEFLLGAAGVGAFLYGTKD